MYHILIHSSVDRHLGCFHVLAMVNSAAVNIQVQKYIFFKQIVYVDKDPAKQDNQKLYFPTHSRRGPTFHPEVGS